MLANGPIAVQQAKFAIKNGMNADLNTGLQIERKAYEVTLPTEDRIEALQAFVEKRKPVFRGKKHGFPPCFFIAFFSKI